MEYRTYLGSVANLDAIADQATADAVVKAALALAREDLGPRRLEQIQRQLPAEWATLFQEAT